MSADNQELDLELLHRARQGQNEARDELVRKYLPNGTAYCPDYNSRNVRFRA